MCTELPLRKHRPALLFPQEEPFSRQQFSDLPGMTVLNAFHLAVSRGGTERGREKKGEWESA